MSTFHYLPDGSAEISFKAAKFNSPKINALANRFRFAKIPPKLSPALKIMT